jgi:hypothetical protein
MLKKSLFACFIFVAFNIINCKAQMKLGQHLNQIKEEHANGELQPNESYGYTYGLTVTKEDVYFLYFLNKELYCYMTVINPLNSGCLQSWIESLNKKWVIVDNFHWKYYREDGTVFNAELRKVKDVDGMCIGFTFAN